jgi:hypothetical protein
MMRKHLNEVARIKDGEFGSPEDPEQFKYLHAYSPYHNVHDGTRYPSVIFVTGDLDSRVDPMQACKMRRAAMGFRVARESGCAALPRRGRSYSGFATRRNNRRGSRHSQLFCRGTWVRNWVGGRWAADVLDDRDSGPARAPASISMPSIVTSPATGRQCSRRIECAKLGNDPGSIGKYFRGEGSSRTCGGRLRRTSIRLPTPSARAQVASTASKFSRLVALDDQEVILGTVLYRIEGNRFHVWPS